jgi:AraC-like DNA-binding protein
VAVSDGERNTVTFSAEDAARPFLTANEAMWEFFEPELRRRLSELETGSTMSERVRAVLLEMLPAGEASVEAVALRLMVSPRTLQRRLREEGTSYQAVLNETREALARHYLSSSSLPAAEISFLLGYEDPNSFYRAFHGWTGETPEGVRTAAMHEVPGVQLGQAAVH